MGLRRGRTVKTEDKTSEQAEAAEENTEAAAPGEEESPPFEADEDQLEADAAAEKAAKDKLEGKKSKPAKTELAAGQAGTGTAVIPADKKPQNNVMAEMEEDGYEGLELGYGSFPILKLENEGIFADSEENEYGNSFKCVIFPTRSKYVLKNTKCEPKEEEVYYSYDRVTTTDGTPITEIIAEWAEDGWGYEVKHYLEAPAQIVEGEFDEEMVMLSIPPASRNKLSGYFYKNRMKGFGSAQEYVTECVVGKKVTTTDHAFYPWKFKYEGPLED